MMGSETGSTFRVSAEALRLSKARRDRSTEEGVGFVGGGLSFSGTELSSGVMQTSGAGLAGELTAGYAFESDGSSLFVQADISLPLYNAGDAYPATFSLAVGFGAL